MVENAYVYIPRCSDGSWYTGLTTNFIKRIEEHNDRKYSDSYSFLRRPVKLVYHTKLTDIRMAIEKEKQTKGWLSQKSKL